MTERQDWLCKATLESCIRFGRRISFFHSAHATSRVHHKYPNYLHVQAWQKLANLLPRSTV